MKIGKDRTPLKVRLSEQIENQADQAADLMQLALKTFENDCTASLSAARNTIENDIQSLLNTSQKMNKSAQPKYLTLAVTSLIAILISLAASWYWASMIIDKAQSASPWSLGLTINNTKNGTVLSWDENRVKLTECRIGNASVKCLQILEKE